MNSSLLASWDRCHRLGLWSREWEPNRVTPLGLVYRALGYILTHPKYTGPQMAREYVMELAGERGVESGNHDPYGTAVHYGHLAEVLARAIRQPNSPALRTYCAQSDHYDVQSYSFEGGTRLLRYVLVDHWDEDRVSSLLHSWDVIGDICVSGLPMTLRALIIGGARNGKRHGYWSRCSRHPSNRQIRFARKVGKEEGFSVAWDRAYREDTGVGPDAWIAQMSRDGILGESVREVQVRVPSESQVKRVLDDIKAIGCRLNSTAIKAEDHPMSRSSCDLPVLGACRFQVCCYAPNGTMSPEETGCFRKRTEGHPGRTTAT